MQEIFCRTEAMFGKEAMDKLASCHIAVFGLGGVGGYVVEALVRSGVGSISLIDNDVVAYSNFNRQIIADTTTLGMLKTDAAEKRAKLINPDVNIIKKNCFFLPENSSEFNFLNYDYVVDAIDTVTAKIELAVKCHELNVALISSMGTGNKFEPTMLEVSDIYKTSVCPLARVMRRELKNRGVKKLKVVYSKEVPYKPVDENYIRTPSSNAFVPSVAGLIIAGEVIKDIIGVGEI